MLCSNLLNSITRFFALVDVEVMEADAEKAVLRAEDATERVDAFPAAAALASADDEAPFSTSGCSNGALNGVEGSVPNNLVTGVQVDDLGRWVLREGVSERGQGEERRGRKEKEGNNAPSTS